jgi:hypothetical protein
MQFSASYLYELGFSALVRIKTSTRERLQLRIKCEYVYLKFVPVLTKNGAGAGFLRVLRFPLPVFIPPIAPQSASSIIWGCTIGQKWPQYLVT